jgi:hypothetical protein
MVVFVKPDAEKIAARIPGFDGNCLIRQHACFIALAADISQLSSLCSCSKLIHSAATKTFAVKLMAAKPNHSPRRR